MKKRAMRLTITLTTEDGVPGHPTRFGEVFAQIKRMLADGSRAGTFDHQFTYSQGGESNSEVVTVDFDVMPVSAASAFAEPGHD